VADFLYRHSVRFSRRGFVLLFAMLPVGVCPLSAQNAAPPPSDQTAPPPPRYVEREVLIPWTEAAPAGLDSLLVYADLPGRHPLAVITHGSSRKPEEHADVSPWQQLPQALWFARRGWVALVVVRRGYGRSGGEEDSRHAGRCPATTYQDAAEYAAQDLQVALDYGRALPNVSPGGAIAVGVSTGGLTAVALTARNPPGLAAAISFAGGRGSRADHDVCNPGELISSFRSFGKTSRVPMLWIYAQNDKYFWPELAQKFDDAFRSKGGNDQLIIAPPFGEDGHALFHRPSVWGDIVDQFLDQQKLAPLTQPLPEIKPPNVPPPPGLSENGQHAFESYLLLGPHKAFATSPHHFGFSSGRLTADEARSKAMDTCRQLTRGQETCTVINVDNTAVP
jgi:dienelactone hydrolase